MSQPPLDDFPEIQPEVFDDILADKEYPEWQQHAPDAQELHAVEETASERPQASDGLMPIPFDDTPVESTPGPDHVSEPETDHTLPEEISEPVEDPTPPARQVIEIQTPDEPLVEDSAQVNSEAQDWGEPEQGPFEELDPEMQSAIQRLYRVNPELFDSMAQEELVDHANELLRLEHETETLQGTVLALNREVALIQTYIDERFAPNQDGLNQTVDLMHGVIDLLPLNKRDRLVFERQFFRDAAHIANRWYVTPPLDQQRNYQNFIRGFSERVEAGLREKQREIGLYIARYQPDEDTQPEDLDQAA